MLALIRAGVRRLFELGIRSPARARRDAEAELAAHLEARMERLVARGMSPEEARDEAIRLLGAPLEVAKDTLARSAERRERRMSIREWVDDVRLDVRYALRGIVREPLFSGFVVLTLALGIGANAAMFGIVDRLMFQGPSHVRDASRVVRLFWTMREPEGTDKTTTRLAPQAYANLATAAHVFSSVGKYGSSIPARFGSGPDARRVTTASATASFFPTLGVRAELGRFFTADEEGTTRPEHVAVLGHGLWRSELAGDLAAIGKTITLDDQPYTIVGVAPNGFTGVELQRVDVWLPLSAPTGPAARHWTRAHGWGPRAVARLKPGVTFAQANADATTVHRQTYDGDEKPYAEARLSVGPLRYSETGVDSAEVSISRWLVGVSVIVLLVACANIVNLLLARAVRRRREMAVRLALGAGRARLARLLLADGVILALLGATAGLAVAVAVGLLVRRTLLPSVDWSSGAIDGRTLAFSAVVALATGIAIGLAPAWRAGRTDVVSALKLGVREGGGHRSLARSLLMMAQAALAMLLLVGAGLFVLSLDRARHVDLGIQPNRVVWVEPNWPRMPAGVSATDQQRENERRAHFAEEAIGRLAALPEIEHAAVANAMPFYSSMSLPLYVSGWDSIPGSANGSVSISAVSADYFMTVGTRLLQGRAFTAADRAGTAPVAIVSNKMAATLWPGRSAVGQCLLIANRAAPCSRVVGVVQDARRNKIYEDPSMFYYVPLGQKPSAVNAGEMIIVRPRGDAAAAVPGLRRILRQLDPSIRYPEATVLQDRVDPQLKTWRVGAMMFSLFAVLALLVAAVGVFSVVAYLVEQRRQEIGVRVALGALGRDVVGLVLRGTMFVTIVGVAIGTVLAVAGGRLLQPLLFQTQAVDPAVYASVAAVLIAAAFLASLIPALRARHVDPMDALRE